MLSDLTTVIGARLPEEVACDLEMIERVEQVLHGAYHAHGDITARNYEQFYFLELLHFARAEAEGGQVR